MTKRRIISYPIMDLESLDEVEDWLFGHMCNWSDEMISNIRDAKERRVTVALRPLLDLQLRRLAQQHAAKLRTEILSMNGKLQ